MRNFQQTNPWINVSSMLLFLFFISSILVTTREGDYVKLSNNALIGKSKSIIRPTRAELRVVTQKIAPWVNPYYNLNVRTNQLWSGKIFLLQFQSPLDFNAFWEFFVGIQFYEFDVDETIKQNKPILLKSFEHRTKSEYSDILNTLYLDGLKEIAKQDSQELLEIDNYNPNIKEEIYCQDIGSAWGTYFYIHIEDFKRIHKKFVQTFRQYFPKDIDIDYYLLWRFCAERTVRYSRLEAELISKTVDICSVDFQLLLSKSKFTKLVRLFDILFKAFKEGNLVIARAKDSDFILPWYTDDNSQYKKVVEFYLPILLEKTKKYIKNVV
jgi:hypothetical protein